jgi:hypothetical protein
LSTSSDLEKVSAGDKKQQYSFTTADNKYFDKKYATDAVTVRLNQDTLARTGPWSSPGLTHEIFVAGPILMSDDVPSRWRGEDYVNREPGSASQCGRGSPLPGQD